MPQDIVPRLTRFVTQLISETNGLSLEDTLVLAQQSPQLQRDAELGYLVREFHKRLGRFRLGGESIETLFAHPVSHAFEAFFRGGPDTSRSGDGTGLGLAISRAIIDSHHGSIWLADARQGTCVCFSIPATSGRWYEAEIHRFKGDLIAAGDGPALDAERCYEVAIDCAKRQGALLFQLRAMNALVSLRNTRDNGSALEQQLALLCKELGDQPDLGELTQAAALLSR